MLKLPLILACAWTWSVAGRTIRRIDFPESIAAPKLVLNGVGLRKKRKFGFNWEVYVAGLYLLEKGTDAEKILADPGPKRLRLVFLRGVKRAQLIESFGEGLRNNCIESCDRNEAGIAAFERVMVDVRAGDEMIISFTKEKTVRLDIDAREKTTNEFNGPGVAINVLAAFIGQKPASAEFKDELLGTRDPP